MEKHIGQGKGPEHRNSAPRAIWGSPPSRPTDTFLVNPEALQIHSVSVFTEASTSTSSPPQHRVGLEIPPL